jgi:hypothetical protein
VADRIDAVQGAVQHAGGPRVGQVGVEVLDVVAEVGGPVGVGARMQPVEETTWWPPETSRSTTWLPTKPARR